MNDEEASQLLDQLADIVPVGPAPVDDLIRSGKSAQRRKRHTTVFGAVAAMALVLVGGVVVEQSVGDNTGSAGPAAPSAPRQTDGSIEEPVEPLGRVEVVRLPSSVGHLPTFLTVNNQRLDTRLACPTDQQLNVDLDSRGWPTLRGIALALTHEPAGSTAVVALTSESQGVLLHLDSGPAVLARTSVVHVNASWFPESSLSCRATSGSHDQTEAVTEADLIGTWVPQMLLGEDVRSVRTVAGTRGTLAFRERRKLTAMDGCNWNYGTYRIGADGTFQAKIDSSTLVGCFKRAMREHSITNVEVLTAANEVRLTAGVLEFLSADGNVIGKYLKADS